MRQLEAFHGAKRCTIYMRAAALFCALILLCQFAPAAERKAKRGTELTAAQKSVLENELIPAYHSRDAVAILNTLGGFVRKAKTAQLEAADEYLKERELPKIPQLLSASRLMLAELDQLGKLPPPRGDELIVSLRGLTESIQSILKMRTGHVAFNNKAPPPESFLHFERRFWDIHVLDTMLVSSRRLAHYGKDWQRSGNKIDKDNLTLEDEVVLTTDFDALGNELKSMLHELTERALELRLRRLEYAVKRLKDSKDIKERFQAAFSVKLDGELLQEFFLEPSDPAALAARDKIVFATRLTDPSLPAEVEELIAQGCATAGEDLMEKSHLLFTGLHWWYRGRYGIGPMGKGLLKSTVALRSPEAHFALFMPRAIPDPTKRILDIDEGRGQQQEQQGYQSPYQRRHVKLWQFETRTLQIEYKQYETFH